MIKSRKGLAIPVEMCFNRSKMNGLLVSETNRIFSLGIGKPLLIGLLCGVCGVLLDLDHPIAYALNIGYPRFLHPVYFYISCGIIIGCISCVGGLLFKMVLKRCLNDRRGKISIERQS